MSTFNPSTSYSAWPGVDMPWIRLRQRMNQVFPCCPGSSSVPLTDPEFLFRYKARCVGPKGIEGREKAFSSPAFRVCGWYYMLETLRCSFGQKVRSDENSREIIGTLKYLWCFSCFIWDIGLIYAQRVDRVIVMTYLLLKQLIFVLIWTELWLKNGSGETISRLTLSSAITILSCYLGNWVFM